MLQEADRLRCATSVLHQADQACRRLISEAMKTAKGLVQTLGLPQLPSCIFLFNKVCLSFVTAENHADSEDMRRLATQLNQTKATYLQDLRKQLLVEAPFGFLQGENIDTERVVKRAVDFFDQQKTEILQRIMYGYKWADLFVLVTLGSKKHNLPHYESC